jgi:predicted signal transduction protein with EAL and GGDEF domain
MLQKLIAFGHARGNSVDRAALQQLRESVGQLAIASAPGRPRITISVGVAEVIADETDAKSFLRRADDALYRAKRAGGNRVCVAAAPPSRLVVRAFPAIEEAAPSAGPIAADQRRRESARVG